MALPHGTSGARVSAPRRPVLRFHGGKWMLAPWIIGHFPPHRAYVEPFGGAASVLLRKPRSKAEIYNDIDGALVQLFQVLRDPARGAELQRLVELTPFSRLEFTRAYETTLDPVEMARRTLVRSWMGFGTTSRKANRTGFRATSHRHHGSAATADWANFPATLPAVVQRLQGVMLECKPALEVIAHQDREDTLFYCDPPYVLSTRSSARGRSNNEHCYADNLDDDQHCDLAQVLHNARGMVVLSGYRCELYDRLYAGWRRVERDAMADGGRRRKECLWLSPRAVEELALLAPARA